MNTRRTNNVLIFGFLFSLLAISRVAGQAYNPWPDIKVEMKPWTRWWWMGSAVDEKNLGNLLEIYAQKGFGGVEITPIYGAKGYEDRFIPFLSDRWMQMLRYTCIKSDTLRMGVDMNTGTGWPFGGPQISLDNAATKIIIQQYNIKGSQTSIGGQGSVRSGQSPIRGAKGSIKGGKGHIKGNQDSIKSVKGHVKVSQGHIKGSQDSIKSSKSSNKVVQGPNRGVKGFPEKIMVNDQKQRDAGAMLQALIAYKSKNKRRVIDLTGNVSPDGKLNWRVPANTEWTLYAAFCGKTLQKVKRAAPGGEGYTLDHFSSKALEQYLSRFDSAFNGNPPKVRCLFNDSYEVYDASWTPSFFEQFLTSRGYDLKKYVRELAGNGELDIAGRVKSDYRQTMSEMLLDNFTANWTRWANTHNMLTRNQAHGSPANLLDLYATVDIPEIETFGSTYFPIPGLTHDSSYMRMADHDPLFLRLASSAAHVSGKNLVSCESFTWLGEHFRVALSRCKPEIEHAFLTGVNHVFYHGTTYSPEDASWPGWLFYASVNFAPSNSFWPHLEGLNRYITRCQSVLQSGKPDNDLLVYWPVYDQWHQADKLEMMVAIHDGLTWVDLPRVRDLLAKGYTMDFISDKQLQETQILEGKLVPTAEGSPYRVLYIPACRFMPLETLKKIVELADSGAYVVMEKLPESVPGLFEYKKNNREFNRMLKNLHFSVSTIGMIKAKCDKGTFLVCQDAFKALEYLGVMRESIVDNGLEFIRRKSEEGTYYYLVNHTSRAVDSIIHLNTRATTLLLLDPMTGEWGKTPSWGNDSITLVRIQLLPGETCFVFAGNKVIPGLPEWSYYVKSLPELSVNGPWELEFSSADTALSAKIKLERLMPWTSLGMKQAECFSGSASYSAEFEVTNTNVEYLLVLDNVHESARVWINGVEAGILWSVPFQCKVGSLLHQGINTIRIEVANLMANRIRAMDMQGIEWKKFYDINMVNIAYKPFNASDWNILPSGLGGTVKLVPLVKN